MGDDLHTTPDEIRRVAETFRGGSDTIATLLDLIAEADEIMLAQSAEIERLRAFVALLRETLQLHDLNALDEAR